MAYKPSLGDVAARVGKAAETWSPMIEHGIKADMIANTQAAATAKWAKEQQLAAIKLGFETSAEQLKEFNTGLANDTFSIAEEGAMRDAYFEAFNRTYDNLEEFYRLSGVPVTQKREKHLTPLISNLFESWKKDNPNGDSAVLKWGKEDGVWGDVMERMHPSIHKDDAQRVWDSLWDEKFKDWKGRETADDDLIKRTSVAGATSEILGGISDFGWEVFDRLGEAGESVWRLENRMSPPRWPSEWGGRRGRGYLEETFGVQSPEQSRSDKPIINPTGEVQTMGMIGGGDGLIDGWLPNMPDAPDEVLAADVSNLGEKVDSLEDIEERAQEREGKEKADATRDISQEAATFLTQLLEAMTAYGNEEAEAMLSREFLNLSSSAKKEIQNYLMSM